MNFLITPWSSELRTFLSKQNSHYSIVQIGGERCIHYSVTNCYIICDFSPQRNKMKSYLRNILCAFEGNIAKVSFYMPMNNYACGSSIQIFDLLKIIIGRDYPFIRLIINSKRKNNHFNYNHMTPINGTLINALDFTHNQPLILKDIQLYSISELVNDISSMFSFKRNYDDETIINNKI